MEAAIGLLGVLVGALIATLGQWWERRHTVNAKRYETTVQLAREILEDWYVLDRYLGSARWEGRPLDESKLDELAFNAMSSVYDMWLLPLPARVHEQLHAFSRELRTLRSHRRNEAAAELDLAQVHSTLVGSVSAVRTEIRRLAPGPSDHTWSPPMPAPTSKG